MASTGSRTLRLLSLLQAQRSWSGAALAGRLGVSTRTLRRDVDRLCDLGYPVESQRGVDGGYRLAPGAALPPLVLEDDEAVALAVGLIGAVNSPIAGTAEASVRALGKVVQVMPKRLRRQVEDLRSMTEPAAWSPPATPVDPEILTTVARACHDEERVELDYVAADGARTRRRVEPHRLVSLERNWYLVAYDPDRGDWRTFRIDRVSAPRATGSRFAPRPLPADDAAAFVRAGITQAPRTLAVQATIDAPADVVRRRLGRWVSVEELTDGTSRVRFSTESPGWAAAVLGATEAELAVDGPPELLAHLASLAGRFSRATSRRAVPGGVELHRT